MRAEPSRSRTRSSTPCATPTASCCRPRAICTSAKRSKSVGRPRCASSKSTSSTRCSMARPATSASSCRAACTIPRCARSKSSGSPTIRQQPRSALRAQRHLSADRRRARTILRRADVATRIEGKSMLPMAGEYTGAVMKDGVRKFIAAYRGDSLADGGTSIASSLRSERLAKAQQAVAGKVHGRPPSFCTGCPERPIFAAMKLVERELGPHHVSCDIGCHLFSILPPFNLGNSTMGYGLGGAGAAALNAAAGKRAIALVGDGGFWHNGLASSFGNAVFNKSDNVMIVVDNGYSAATGGQDVPSSAADNSMRATKNPIEKAVRGVGVKWVRTITRTYDVGKMRDALKEALTTAVKGPKVVIAQSECMLNKERRVRPLMRKRLER